MTSVYIHIPFCLRKCIYCDFPSIEFDEELSAGYVDALKREISLREGGGPALETLYMGGGTPTVLPAGGLMGIFDSLRRRFEFHPDAEITIEANPATIDMEKLEVLRGAGASRLSLGVQSFDDGELKTLGRLHSGRDALEAVGLAKESGFENLSVDLIYGIPGQDVESLRRSLERALSTGAGHLSLYELTVEEGTPLWRMVKGGAIRMPHEDEILAMRGQAMELLAKAGYIHYEVSSFALPGRECRHNVNYWQRGGYIGLGAAAHSFDGKRRWRNTPEVSRYIRNLAKGVLPVVDIEEISPAGAAREFLFLGLRMTEGVALEAASFYELDIEGGAKGLVDDGLLAVEAERLRVTARAFPVLNRVMVRLFEGLGL